VRKKISQVEAWSLRHEVKRYRKILDDQKRYWLQGWPQGVHLESLVINAETMAMVRTARKLGHAVVVTQVNAGKIELYALELPRSGEAS
jgi:hypothetical protein